MANDPWKMSLEERVQRCALAFEVNALDFAELADQSGKALVRKPSIHGMHRELVAESEERVERSRRLLSLTNRLVTKQATPIRVVSARPSRRGPLVMKRAILLEHLTLAEEHIEIGSRNIARQEEIIEALEAHGHDTLVARRMLKNFEDAQALNLEELERIRKELRHEEP
jgi:hypothetical protein